MNECEVKIYIVDDHPLVREWLSNLIHQQPNLRVCGEAEKPSDALRGIETTKPDIAIVDISLKDGSGIELMKNIRALGIGVAIIVLSMHDESLYAERAFRAGARAYIVKRETSKNVVAAIREVMAGKLYLTDSLKAAFAERFIDGKMVAEGLPVRELSDRELEVFQLLGEGLETRQIAKMLNISMKTVQVFCARIKEKLNLKSATQLLREAVRWHDSQQNR